MARTRPTRFALTLIAAGLGACAATPAPQPPAPPIDTSPAAPLPEGCSIPLGAEYYPADARRRGASGVVTASFRLDARGEPAEVTLLAGSDGLFAAAARQMLKASHCRPPAAPPAGTPAPHYVIDLQFVLLPCRMPQKSERASIALTVCASRKH
jgi:TonB family protein